MGPETFKRGSIKILTPNQAQEKAKVTMYPNTLVGEVISSVKTKDGWETELLIYENAYKTLTSIPSTAVPLCVKIG